MQVKDVMTADPAFCTRETSLQEVAQMMIAHDCGEIPIVENKDHKIPIGVITDRDIVCRTVAKGLNPLDLTVLGCMSEPCVTVTADTSLEQCCRILEQNQIRRVPVVDADGVMCGIVSLADVALQGKESAAAHTVKEISEPTAAASAAGR
jgi:CBS domain-containing protein